MLLIACCFGEVQTIITSDSLEYSEKTSTYIAIGNAKVQKAETVIEADEIRYNEQTSETAANGHVRLNDPDVSITADRAELDLDEKTGIIYDSEIFYKKDNVHISGKIIEKKGENYYVSPEASFTTCDAPVPAWCFSGKNVDAVTGEKLKAKDATFHIMDVPVFYTPYLWSPLLTERQTGFLIPTVGYSTSRGAQFHIPFYWAISENRDATISLDEYSKRGLGEGLEYRYLEPEDVKGRWSFYHVSDRELSKEFFELRGLHEQRSTEGIGGFLNVNYINEKDFYREYNTDVQIRSLRFLESTGEISVPFSNSRGYLLSQYWIDLKENTESPPQKLPEVGYVVNPFKIGHLWFSSTSAVSNIWKDEGVDGQRIDIFPKIYHAFGDDVIFLQTLGFRERAYFLQRSEDDSLHRENLEYTVSANTVFLKKYSSFTHIVEPSLSYTYVSDSGDNLPVFDSAELFKKTSRLELSLLNRIMNKNGELMVVKVAQGYDTYHSDRTFFPLSLEIGIKWPLFMRLATQYDVHTGKVDNINSDVIINILDTLIMAGQRYDRQNDITFYSAGIKLHPFKPLYLESKIWYDGKAKQVSDFTSNIILMRQCWGLNLGFVKKPGDFTVTFLFELKGITKPLKMW